MIDACETSLMRMPQSWRWLGALIVLIAAAGLQSCATRLSGPYVASPSELRSPLRSEQLTLEGTALMASDPDEAERLLREALNHDLFNAQAHNNLGVLYLAQGDWYGAANEFEWARKLLPGHPDPRLNLALTLERAGRIDEAIVNYRGAMEVYPGHLPTMQALARCQLRYNRSDEHTVDLLDEIALAGETARWRAWAREQQLRLEPPTASD